MADKLICISNDNTQNNLLCRLQLVVETFDTQGHEPTSQNWNSIKVLKLLRQRIRKRYNKILETRNDISICHKPNIFMLSDGWIANLIRTAYPVLSRKWLIFTLETNLFSVSA